MTPAPTITSRSPPPQYTPAIIPNTEQGHDYDDDYDYDDYDYDEDYHYDDPAKFYPSSKQLQSSQRNPNDASKTITINLDTSISILGDGNTIAIASPSSSSTSSNGQVQESQSPSTGPSKSKLANTTAAIVAALQQSGVISQSQSQDSRSEANLSASMYVKINIDAGVKIQGSRNMVCFGAVVSGSKAGTAAGGRAGLDSRKRRAQSEPVHSEVQEKRYKRC